MHYIELPIGIDSLEQDEDAKYFFYYGEKKFYLDNIIERSNQAVFHDSETELTLFVGNRCPNEDKFFVEYLPGSARSTGWCKIQNGIKKAEDNKQYCRTLAWTSSSGFSFLSSRRREEVEAERKEQRDDRRMKGPKSV